MSRKLVAPGDLIYLSERKLFNLATEFGIRTGLIDHGVTLKSQAGIDVGIPSLGRVSANGSVQAAYIDPARHQKALARQLDVVVRKLGGDRIPSLENADDGIREGHWFRFHRKLRFGVGHADAIPEIKALVVVDEKPAPEGFLIPRLLMNGSVAHVRDPYATEEMRNAPGSRSGSSSDRLFIWLNEARQVLESDSSADLRTLRCTFLDEELSPRDAHNAMEMYGAFAREHPTDPPLFPPLLNAAPCEGVAQVTFMAVDEIDTLVIASPLFVRVRALPEQKTGWWRASRRAGFPSRARP